MTKRKGLITGRLVQCEVPDWRPLARVASEELMCSFMWMGEIGTRRGERFHVYKHCDTRCSIHIDLNGKGLAYDPDEDRYERIPAWVILRAVLRPWWERGSATPEEIALSCIAIDRAREDEWGTRPMLTPKHRRDLARAFEGALLCEPEYPTDDDLEASGVEDEWTGEF